MRWIHPDKGIIPPATFIALAEETSLIIPMGEWAIRAACQENKRWQAEGYSPITVSVNISAKQFFTMDVERSITTLLEFQRIGVKVSIDDFGIGLAR